jgi:hypothetical protein
MTVGGDLLGLDLGDRSGGAEEGLGGGHIAGLTEINIDQGAVAVDRPVQIAPFTGHLDIGVRVASEQRIRFRPDGARGAKPRAKKKIVRCPLIMEHF